MAREKGDHLEPEAPDEDIARALFSTCASMNAERSIFIEMEMPGRPHRMLACDSSAETYWEFSGDFRHHFPWAFHKLTVKQAPIYFPSLESLPPEAAPDRRSWSRDGILSGMLLPLLSGEKTVFIIGVYNFLGLSETQEIRTSLLRPCGELVAALKEKRRLEQTVAHCEERFATAVANSSDGLLEWVPGASTAFLSNRFKELLGFRPDEVPGEASFFWEHLHPEDHPRVMDAVERHLREETPFQVEFRLRPRSGDYRWFSAQGRALRNAWGEVHLMSCNVRDITEWKRIEGELRVQVRFEALLAGLASRFVDVSLSRVGEEIDAAMRDIRAFFEADICTFASISPEPGQVRLISFVSSLNDGPIPGSFDARGIFPWMYEAFRQRCEPICIHDTETLPRQAQRDRETYRARGIRALLVIPIRRGKLAEYAIAIASSRPGLDWSERYSPRLRLLGETLANVISRTQAEAKLRETELHYRTIAEFTHDWEYWIGPENDIRFMSPSAERVTGFQAESFIGNFPQLQSLVLEEDRQAWEAHIREGCRPDAPPDFQFRIRRRDGSIRWIEHTSSRVTGTDGEYLGLRVCNRDITERCEIEQALREKDHILAEAQRIAHIGSWEWHIDQDRLTWTDEVYRIFGLSPQRSEVTIGDFFSFIHPDDRKRVRKNLDEALADPDRSYAVEHRIVLPNGSVRVVFEQGEITFGQDGKPRKMMGTVLDVTARRQAEDSLRNALEEIGRYKERLEAENILLRQEVSSGHRFKDIIGSSRTLKNVLYRIEQVASTRTTVLFTGETGTGKSVFARAVHDASDRKLKPFVNVNCAGLPLNLIESELFGREKGAFTGADTKQIGRFELANGGTIFLDEIGELPLETQAKLLRVIESQEFERLGSPKTVKVDVRIITATNRTLEDEVRLGRFRQDLFYRLNVFPISIPPLRQRREDIPLLVHHYIEKIARTYGKAISAVPENLMAEMERYSWPGNVRELINVVERAVIVTEGPVLQFAGQLASRLSDNARPAESFPVEFVPASGDDGQSLAAIEREHIRKTLEDVFWRVEGPSGAAAALGMNASTLRARMRKLGLRRPEARPRSTR